MANNLETLALGAVLTASSRDQLNTWLISNRTGDATLRAGLPNDWRVGDKTSAGEHGSTNDVAIVWSPQRRPVVIAVYLTETTAAPEQKNAALADIARHVVRVLKI